MVRMADILKRAKERERKAKEERQKKPFIEPTQQEAPLESVKLVKEVLPPEVKADEVEKPKIEQQPEAREQKEEEAKPSEVRISPVVMKGTKVASGKESLELYEALMSLMKEILKEDINHESIDVKQITAWIEKVIEQLSLDNKKLLLELALIKDSKDEHYLLCHSINVCIYSVEIGLGLGYEKSKLIELGISSLLHDVGMLYYLHLSNQSRKLTAREYNDIKNHPIKASEVLEKIDNLPKIASYIIHQHHERIDGSGYPRGLKKESIIEYAKIVNIVDVFEAMTHLRPYRNEFLPLEALREILTNKNAFEYRVIKILIERISIFPIGSLVELNTKEIAQVVKLNHAVPLRSVVKIIYDTDGEEPKETRILDLTTQPTIYIKKAVRKDELRTTSTNISQKNGKNL